ncbi:MAG: family 43 glycosylhydrolase [Rubrobacteraceae bacterium]|nr:family 43 glycosylhydrolase [Rubrobacteraceae bacterium]
MFKYCRLSTASIFILVALLALPGCGEEDNPTSESPTFKNPVYDTNFPDPHIIRADGKYYAYSTNDSGANVPTLRSENLVDWTVGENAMPELAPWTAPGKTWAPEVLHREDGKYALYYTPPLPPLESSASTTHSAILLEAPLWTATRSRLSARWIKAAP